MRQPLSAGRSRLSTAFRAGSSSTSKRLMIASPAAEDELLVSRERILSSRSVTCRDSRRRQPRRDQPPLEPLEDVLVAVDEQHLLPRLPISLGRAHPCRLGESPANVKKTGAAPSLPRPAAQFPQVRRGSRRRAVKD